MDREELEIRDRSKKQRLVSRPLKQQDRDSSAKKKPNKVVRKVVSVENLDTVSQKSKNWLVPGILAAVSIAITAATIGSQLTKQETTSNAAPKSDTSLSNPPAVISSAERESEAQMLLEQAKLIANQNQPQKLARAISIVTKLPTNTAVTSEAQSLAVVWSQKILQEANNKASGGKLNEAIAIAQLVPDRTEASQAARQQIKQWQQQQRQAEQKKFAATLAAVSKLPASPPVTTLPPPPPLQSFTQTAKSVAPQSKSVPQTKTTVNNTPANASVDRTQLKPAVRSQRDNPNNSGQLLARDPYLNVTIGQVNVPQLQAKTNPSAKIVTNSSSYGFRNNYGFRNLKVAAPVVAIELRDNVDEDGDYVSLIVNGKTYTRNQLILNHGKIFMVDLQPGENRVDIVGVRDGQGGITLEVNVAGIGNINNRPIPEGSTASFIINREK